MQRGELVIEGQIRQSLSGFYDVVDENGNEYRTRGRGNFRNRKITPLVGDRVTFEDGYLLSVLPRHNQLVRPPIANVDQAIVASAVVEPAFSTNLLDRQLLALEIADIEPIIYFTKTDLLNDSQWEQFENFTQGYEQVGYTTILPQTAFDEPSLTAIEQHLAHKVSVFMGQTGAGKSTLLNHLMPALALETGEISAALNRGKHTTRRVSLMPIFNGLVADTPGFSSYDAFDVDARNLASYFPEFRRASVDCKFRGCVHINEPGCAVKEAVSAGHIMQSRYDNYLLLYQDIKNQKPNYKK